MVHNHKFHFIKSFFEERSEKVNNQNQWEEKYQEKTPLLYQYHNNNIHCVQNICNMNAHPHATLVVDFL